MDRWLEWNPPHAPEVRGRYTVRVPAEEGEMPEPQKVEARCLRCGAEWRGDCHSGSVRTHIARFGGIHAHRDPFAPKGTS